MNLHGLWFFRSREAHLASSEGVLNMDFQKGQTQQIEEHSHPQ